MAGMYSSDAPSIIEHANTPLAFTPRDIRWLPPAPPRFIAVGTAANGSGQLELFNLNRTGVTSLARFTRPAGVQVATFRASPSMVAHVAVGDVSGRLAILDLNRDAAPVFESSGSSHAGGINAMDGSSCGPVEVVTGGRDGSVQVWDVRVETAVVRLQPEEGSSRDCWAVSMGGATGELERVVLSGYDNGDVKLFDLKMNAMRWEGNAGSGVTCIDLDCAGALNKMVVTCLESKFKVFDLSVLPPASVSVKGHKSTIWTARHTPQRRDVWATTGGNGGVNLYRYIYPASRSSSDESGGIHGVPGSVELLNSRVVTSQPIVGFDWHPEKMGLAAMCALDQTARVTIVTKLDKY